MVTASIGNEFSVDSDGQCMHHDCWRRLQTSGCRKGQNDWTAQKPQNWRWVVDETYASAMCTTMWPFHIFVPHVNSLCILFEWPKNNERTDIHIVFQHSQLLIFFVYSLQRKRLHTFFFWLPVFCFNFVSFDGLKHTFNVIIHIAIPMIVIRMCIASDGRPQRAEIWVENRSGSLHLHRTLSLNSLVSLLAFVPTGVTTNNTIASHTCVSKRKSGARHRVQRTRRGIECICDYNKHIQHD